MAIFNPIVPLSTESPGVFPAQNNGNFTRLKTLISGDHIFNDSDAANDGTHKQVTTTFRADPTSLPMDTNGMIFNKLDTVSNASQLYWYDGTNIEQMTGQTKVLTGKATVAADTSLVIFANPGYTYMAIAWGAEVSTSEKYTLRLMMKQPTTNVKVIVEASGSASDMAKNVSFNFGPGSDLRIKNNNTSSMDLIWTLNITRLAP